MELCSPERTQERPLSNARLLSLTDAKECEQGQHPIRLIGQMNGL